MSANLNLPLVLEVGPKSANEAGRMRMTRPLQVLRSNLLSALVTLEDGPKSANEARRLLQTRLDECECERVKMYDEGPIRTCSAVGLKSVSLLEQLGLPEGG